VTYSACNRIRWKKTPNKGYYAVQGHSRSWRSVPIEKPKFQAEGDGVTPTNNFSTDSLANECLTTLWLIVFTQTNFVADFLQWKCDFRRKSTIIGGLGATYDYHRRLFKKGIMDFLLVLTELVFAMGADTSE